MVHDQRRQLKISRVWVESRKKVRQWIRIRSPAIIEDIIHTTINMSPPTVEGEAQQQKYYLLQQLTLVSRVDYSRPVGGRRAFSTSMANVLSFRG